MGSFLKISIEKFKDMNYKAGLQELAKGNFEKDILYDALLLKGEEKERLFNLVRKKRSQYFSSEKVEVRSVIEISNIC